MLRLILNTRNKHLVDMLFSRRKNKKVFSELGFLIFHFSFFIYPSSVMPSLSLRCGVLNKLTLFSVLKVSTYSVHHNGK